MSRWVPAALAAAAVYFLISGLLLAELAGRASTEPMRFGWRMTSWVIGAVAFTAHLGYEQLRLNTRPRTTALHAAAAVAIGMSLLALAALIRALVTHTGKPALLALAIVLWPLIAGVPAFVAGWLAAAIIDRMRRV